MTIAKGKYHILENIGNTNQSFLKLATNTQTGKKLVLKLEDSLLSKDVLQHEMKILNCLSHIPGIPRVYDYGKESFYSYLAIQRLRKSLYQPNSISCLSQLAYLGCQAIQILKHIHISGYLYCNMKPSHMMLGRSAHRNLLYFIDFKLTLDQKTDKCVDLESIDAVYASLNVLGGVEYSKRDDLEALCYCLIALHDKKLPWDRDKLNSKHIVFLSKLGMSIDRICASCPVQFCKFLEYCRSLDIQDIPDYAYLSSLMQEIIIQEPYHNLYNPKDLLHLIHKREKVFLKHHKPHSTSTSSDLTSQLNTPTEMSSPSISSFNLVTESVSSIENSDESTPKSDLPSFRSEQRRKTLKIKSVYVLE